MRQKNETATSFNQLKEITQAIQAQKTSAQTSTNANTSEPTQKSAPKTKATAHAKNHALKPTKRAFSERQRTTIRDNSQASANLSRGTKENNNANAFKADEAFKQGLKNTRIQPKGAKR